LLLWPVFTLSYMAAKKSSHMISARQRSSKSVSVVRRASTILNRMLFRLGALRTIVEAAVEPARAKAQGTAVIVTTMGDDVSVIAYDPKQLIDDVIQGVKAGDDPVDSVEKNGTAAIVGIVSMHPAGNEEGPCHGAYIVQAAAARQGYGPLLYDLAMSLGRPVVPDRKSVSPAARNVWDRYVSRGDVSKLPLDNKASPKTTPVEDDCITFDDMQSLNYAFSKQGSNDLSGFADNDKHALNSYNAALASVGGHKVDYSSWHQALTLAAADYFAYRYAKG
jgi:hypothetical protein